ncbi:glycosyltransferase family 4 protein [Streptomyces sp. 21So2-11]|uniref:glycosyltransferase family 4 protein n=1 Tax=Streptomyces sp. 21So2-11 TaxID=3144408 RepID=UPI00321B97E8
MAAPHTQPVGRPVHFVMPGGVDDAAAPSGGNLYDLRLCRELTEAGWQVHGHSVPGDWPQPGPVDRARLAELVASLPNDSVVLLDGLVACAVPELIVPAVERLRVAVVVHLPLADETGLSAHEAAQLDARERETLRAVPAVVATSTWTARQIAAHHGLVAARVHVAAPGTDPADPAHGTDGVSRLLCVASVTPRKGHDRLVQALGSVADLPWECFFVGAVDESSAYVAGLRAEVEKSGLSGRVHFTGARTGPEFQAAFAAADLMVLTSYAETYGMALTEALARAIPVLAVDVGGVREAVGHAPDGHVPGMLLPTGDPAEIASAMRRWFDDSPLRRRLKEAALARRETLDPWGTTARHLTAALESMPSTARKTGCLHD